MAIVGSIQDGLTGDHTLLFSKSLLDFVIVMVFAATFGLGVMFSALPLGILQGRHYPGGRAGGRLFKRGTHLRSVLRGFGAHFSAWG